MNATLRAAWPDYMRKLDRVTGIPSIAQIDDAITEFHERSADQEGRFWVKEYSGLSPARQTLHHALRLIYVMSHHFPQWEVCGADTTTGFSPSSAISYLVRPKEEDRFGHLPDDPIRIAVKDLNRAAEEGTLWFPDGSDEFIDWGFGVQYLSANEEGGYTISESPLGYDVAVPHQCGGDEIPAMVFAPHGPLDSVRVTRASPYSDVVISTFYLNAIAEAVDALLFQAGRLNRQIADGKVSSIYQAQVELLGRFALSHIADLAVQILAVVAPEWIGDGVDAGGGGDGCCSSKMVAHWLFNLAADLGWPAAGEFSLIDYDFSETYSKVAPFFPEFPPTYPVATALPCADGTSFMTMTAVMRKLGDTAPTVTVREYVPSEESSVWWEFLPAADRVDHYSAWYEYSYDTARIP